MGGVAILHPDNLLHTPKPMRSRRTTTFMEPNSRRRKKNTPAAVITKPTAAAETKNVIGQVKILKRAELLEESSPVKKEVQEDKKKKMSYSNPKFQASKTEKVVICRPDPKMVSKQMKNITEYFAGSAYFDSPSPSSLPLPGFFDSQIIND